MSTDKPSEPDRSLPDDQADRLTYETMRQDGKFVPQSPEEVARAEAEIDEAAVELPPGLRDPLAILNRVAPSENAPESTPSGAAQSSDSDPVSRAAEPATVAPSTPASAQTSPQSATRARENRMRGTRLRKLIAWLVLVGTVATVIGSQLIVWRSRTVALRDADLAAAAPRAEMARVEAEQAALKQEARKPLDAALAAETELRRQAWTERENARKVIAEKEFTVRLTGPEHVQPGAPNKWQIETLRHGAVARPKKVDVIVKDAKDVELFRQTHDKPVGVATLELTPAFWQNVKQDTELFLNVVAHTDDRATVLAERLPLSRPVFVTHLVTDKPLYKPGELIRFRSLTLDRSTLRPPQHDQRLIFKLRDPSDAVVPLEEGNGRLLRDLQPVLGPDKRPVRGIGVGEHQLSADAPGGEYKLDLFEVSADTRKEVLLETRKFIVNRYVPDVFEKKLEFDGKSYGPGEFVQARIEVSRTAGGPMRNATAVVVATSEGKTFHEQRGEFRLITDASGAKTVLDVRFKLPASVFDAAKPDVQPSATLSVTIQDGGDVETIVRPIPLVTKTLKVEFFPEGGDLIDGVPGRVYFMVRTPGGDRDLSPAKPGFTAAPGKPADLKGRITDGTNTICEVATLTDAENPGVNRGHGVFSLKPEPGKKYFLKLASPVGITEPTKDGFPLPTAKPDGVALTALDAVTARGGAIRVRVQSPVAKTLHVGAYVREHLIAQQKVTVGANAPAELALRGAEAAGGVTRITVFEERRDDGGRVALLPRAERLVFRASGEHLVLSATPDKLRYSPSDKVRLDLSATTEKGQPAPAVLLVGVVNRSVITMADNKHDRLQSTHFLLSGEVRNSAELEHADFLLTDHPQAAVALDLLLGTQGWRRFAEQDVAPANPTDKPDVDKLLVAHGQRPSAPLELFKLEEQRVHAEFAPRLEMARLNVAALDSAWRAVPPAMLDKLSEVRANLSVAEAKQSEAAGALRRCESRFELARHTITGGIVLGVILVALFLFIRQALPTTTSTFAGSRRALIFIGCVVVAVCGLLFMGLYRVQYAPKSERVLATSAEWSEEAWDAAPAPPSEPPLRDGRFMRDAGPRQQMVWMEEPKPTAKPSKSSNPKTGNTPLTAQDVLKQAVSHSKGSVSKRAGATLSDRARVLDAFRARSFDRPLMGREFDPRARANPPMNERMAVPIAEDAPTERELFGVTLLSVPPFVVREYAHQRDPALGEVRADFTETVYWHPVLVLPDNGKATVEFQLSDDVARYQVLVAGHTLDGRVGAITQTIEARKPFSLDPKLPLEIAHTDTIDVPIRATNDSDTRRTVAFKTTLAGLKPAGALQDTIDLGPNGKGRKLLRLTADKLEGDAGVLIEGVSGPDRDAIARTIRVVPDGFPRVGSISDMMETRARGSITLPKDVVPGSLRVRLEVYPTSMADLVKGLDGLLREPHGCFEQTSTTNYPNTMILDYMNQTNQANPAAAAKAKDFLARGYGRLTSFECPDTPTRSRQGFEWFGAADQQHEALTAYGLLQVKDMARVHPVAPELIKRTQAFLMSRRDGQGGFKQKPRGYHSWSGSKQIVDAYIVWALVESDPEDAEKLDLRTEIAALKAAALNESTDPYFLALVANVLLMRGDRESAHRLLDRLQEKYTRGGRVIGATSSVTQSGGRDLVIETTALTLLGWLRANDPKYATTSKDATKWISQQRGGYGGFGSTQSTILALKALTLFAKKTAHPPEAGELRVKLGGQIIGTRRFTEQDVEVIGLDIPNPDAVFKSGERNEVEITTSAKQAYPFALSYTYTSLTPVSAAECAVQIATRLGKGEVAEGESVPLSVTLENKVDKGHGMAVAIVGIPAGMRVPTDMKQLTDLREKGRIAYFETRGRELVLYWRELGPKQKIELTVDLVCDVPGAYRGPASRGYLYYDADHKHWVEPLSVKIAPAEGGMLP